MGAWSSLMDLLFPPRCAFCRKYLKPPQKHVCPACEESLPRTKNGGAQKGDFFSVCVSPLYYEGAVRDSIRRYKFGGATAYSELYGKYTAECIRENLSGKYDLISWVPLSPGRLKKRGYDQSMLLAMATALELGDVTVSTLEKTREVSEQSLSGSPERRRANISGAYEAADPELIEGKRILLLDDIITSGTTLSECARVLLTAGAREVLACTLARSHKD